MPCRWISEFEARLFYKANSGTAMAVTQRNLSHKTNKNSRLFIYFNLSKYKHAFIFVLQKTKVKMLLAAFCRLQ